MKEYAVRIDESDQLYAGRRNPDTSGLRRLALAVIARAVFEAETKSIVKNFGVTGIADNPFEWLKTWDLVEPWCLAAGLSPSRLKRRIAILERARIAA